MAPRFSRTPTDDTLHAADNAANARRRSLKAATVEPANYEVLLAAGLAAALLTNGAEPSEAAAPLTASQLIGSMARPRVVEAASGPAGRVYIADELGEGAEPSPADDAYPGPVLNSKAPRSTSPATALASLLQARLAQAQGHHASARVAKPVVGSRRGPSGEGKGDDRCELHDPCCGSAQRDDRADFLRGLRRIWMGSTFRREPHALITATVHLAGRPDRSDAARGAILDRACAALRSRLTEVGAVHPIERHSVTAIVANIMLPQALEIASQIMSISWAAALSTDPDVAITAGVAILYRNEDPATAFCLSEDNCRSVAYARWLESPPTREG